MPKQRHSRKTKPHHRQTAKPSQSARIFGVHSVIAALKNRQRDLRKLYVTPEVAKTHGGHITKIVNAREGELVIHQCRGVEISDLLPPHAVHQGIVLETSPLPEVALEDLTVLQSNESPALILVLDQVQDPHNLGAILRSAAAFGADAVVVQDRHSPPLNETVLKTASGGAEHVPLVRVSNLARSLEKLQAAEIPSYGFAGEAETSLDQSPLPNRLALVLGGEGPGLRRLTKERCDHLVRLPTQGAIVDLNVSNAAAIALYAARMAAPLEA